MAQAKAVAVQLATCDFREAEEHKALQAAPSALAVVAQMDRVCRTGESGDGRHTRCGRFYYRKGAPRK